MKYSLYCNHTPKIVFAIDDVNYYAADANGVIDFTGDFVVNFTRMPNVSSVVPELAPYIDIPFEEIIVPWPDYEIPKVKISFWGALHDFIRQHSWRSVCFHCGMGHGRTGTGLSSLIIASTGCSAKEATDIIRTNHCEEAVESFEQCHYLQEVDKYYNGREPSIDTCPIPSMMLGRLNRLSNQERGEDEKNKRLFDVSGTA